MTISFGLFYAEYTALALARRSLEHRFFVLFGNSLKKLDKIQEIC